MITHALRAMDLGWRHLGQPISLPEDWTGSGWAGFRTLIAVQHYPFGVTIHLDESDGAFTVPPEATLFVVPRAHDSMEDLL